MWSYLTSFLVNSPTLSSCSSSGILSSIRCWTISAILSTQPLRLQARLLFCDIKVINVNFILKYHQTVKQWGWSSHTHMCGSCDSPHFRVRLQIAPSGNTMKCVRSVMANSTSDLGVIYCLWLFLLNFFDILYYETFHPINCYIDRLYYDFFCPLMTFFDALYYAIFHPIISTYYTKMFLWLLMTFFLTYYICFR